MFITISLLTASFVTHAFVENYRTNKQNQEITDAITNWKKELVIRQAKEQQELRQILESTSNRK